MERFKYSVAVTFGGLLMLFAIQNMASVELNFLFWSFQSKRFVVIGFALVTGFLLGWVFGARKKTPPKDDAGL